MCCCQAQNGMFLSAFSTGCDLQRKSIAGNGISSFTCVPKLRISQGIIAGSVLLKYETYSVASMGIGV